MNTFESYARLLGFTAVDGELMYKVVNDVAFTISANTKFLLVSVAMPQQDWKTWSSYIAQNFYFVAKIKKAAYGIQVYFYADVLDELSTIADFTEKLSLRLREEGLVSSDAGESRLVCKKNMFILVPSASQETSTAVPASSEKPVEEACIPTEPELYTEPEDVFISVSEKEKLNMEASEEFPPLKDTTEVFPDTASTPIEGLEEAFSGKDRLPDEDALSENAELPLPVEEVGTQSDVMAFSLMILIVLGFSMAFFVLCIFAPYIASPCGYLMGWLGTAAFLKYRKQKRARLAVLFPVCLAGLLISAFFAFLCPFLAQTELYTIYDYLHGSFSAYYCLFNLLLGSFFALYGVYATLPARKKVKKTKEPVEKDESQEY